MSLSRIAAFGATALLAAAVPGDPALLSDIAATVGFLASPELGGRGCDEAGGAVASAYIASRLQAAGWIPAGDAGASGRSFYQTVPAVSARFMADRSYLAMTPPGSGASGKGEAARLSLAGGGVRFVPDRASAVDVSAEIVFAGFGIRAPEFGRDDYAGFDPRGRAVLVFSGEPGELDPASPWNGTRPTRHLLVSTKQALAASLGATALLVVPNPAGRAKTADDLAGGPMTGASAVWLGAADAREGIPVLYLDPDAAAKILAGSGFDLAAAAGEVEAGRSGARLLGGRRIAVHLEFGDRREVPLRNVVARLGSGSGLDGDAVLLGAHWDHLGSPGGVVHPGADDNASGIAALLAVAAELKANPPGGKREVVLAAWTGEERGLLGSAYFTRHPVVPLDRLAVAVNLDGLGRNNLDKPEYAQALQVIYSAAVPALRELAAAANADHEFDLRFYPSLRFRPISDHASFHAAGVPIVYPFAGYHSDYHEATDTVAKVLPERIARASRFVARLMRELARTDKPLGIDATIHEAPKPDPFETPYGG